MLVFCKTTPANRAEGGGGGGGIGALLLVFSKEQERSVSVHLLKGKDQT